ncbi:MAG: 4-hydroxythreonine-4-phosphate dehydrogenase PdxA [Elusimicrobiota bacterium]|jgi:4-hydroxythreonine-4-phosphate dehydrogenase|nr:4-hydroxythreonine-4-phosphate dehydrogenase PdxA [Elusimicrobiota bacterium]
MIKTKVAVTLGDPAGIGAEVVRKAVNHSIVRKCCSPFIFGDSYFKKYFKNFEFVETSALIRTLNLGTSSKIGGVCSYLAIEKAVQFCLKKECASLTTAPVSKESFKAAGTEYLGHTELLCDLTKSKKVAMLMICGKLNSVMVTRHIPLFQIPKILNTKDIVENVHLGADFLKNRIAKKKIRIALCGLNPHCGENSILGSEEKDIILPAFKILKKHYPNIVSPRSADSVWLKAKNDEYDLVCAMYHDQVMIPLKCIDARKIVNVTAGLPFTRTSPGHGTAFDIAGQNKADPTPMIQSILTAASTK